MTPAGFPHSDTPGSTLGCQLPRAYRRLLRPSSALDAKASTMCPSQLVTHTTNPHHPHTRTRPHPHKRGADPDTRTQEMKRAGSAHNTPQRNKQNNKQRPPTTPPGTPPAPHQKTGDKSRHARAPTIGEMLASTIQISNNNPTPAPTHHHDMHRPGRAAEAPNTPHPHPATTRHTHTEQPARAHQTTTTINKQGRSDPSEPQQRVCRPPPTRERVGVLGLFPHL